MNTFKSTLSLLALLLFSETAMAGLAPPVIVPIDSPWMLIGLSVALATVGVRLFNNKRK